MNSRSNLSRLWVMAPSFRGDIKRLSGDGERVVVPRGDKRLWRLPTNAVRIPKAPRADSIELQQVGGIVLNSPSLPIEGARVPAQPFDLPTGSAHME